MIKSFVVVLLVFLLEGSAVASIQKRDSVSIRNFRELYLTFSLLTGVSPNHPETSDYFSRAKSRLSLDGDVRKINAPMTLATTSLASVFCHAFIESEARSMADQRRIHEEVNFSQGMSAISRATRAQVIQRYAQAFWGRSASSVEEGVVLNLMEQIEANDQGEGELVPRVFEASCTSMLSSLDSLKI